MDESRTRKGHAYADRASRELKAEKIFRILSAMVPLDSVASVLEIGCGSGYIAAWWARALPEARVVGVDIADQREDSSFEFHQVDGVKTPFDDETFDVVISNHVIEHVGSTNQLGHLKEIQRLLRPKGVAYLATPRRFSLIEPHFKLPLLGWFSAPLNDAYVKATGKGTWYDVDPLTAREVRGLASAAGLVPTDVTARALYMTLSGDGTSPWLERVLSFIGTGWHLVRAFTPTMVWTMRPGSE